MRYPTAGDPTRKPRTIPEFAQRDAKKVFDEHARQHLFLTHEALIQRTALEYSSMVNAIQCNDNPRFRMEARASYIREFVKAYLALREEYHRAHQPS